MSRRNWRYTDESLTTAVMTGSGARGRKHEPGKMNQTEARYAAYLMLRAQVGEIAWWAFEGIKFKIDDSCFYTPDFAVMMKDLELRIVDVKGTQVKSTKAGISYDRPYIEEDARIKMKALKRLFPLPMFVAFESGRDNWIEEEI